MAKKQEAEAKTNLPVNVAEELRKQREANKARLGALGGGDVIRVTQTKKFVMPDGTEGPGPLRLVILDFVASNYWHDRPYKKGEESPPACFSIGPDANTLVPSPNSPVLQVKPGQSCADCAFNEWGSRGKGKECDNLRFLAVRQPGAEASPIYIIKVSPTASKGYDAYVNTLDVQFDGVPIEFETEISFNPNLEFPSLQFANLGRNKHVNEHFGQQKAAQARLLVEPDVSQYKPLVAAKPAAKRR